MLYDNKRFTSCAEMLGSINIFRNLSYQQRQQLALLCHCRRYQAGQKIIFHGATSKDVYFIVSGHVQAIVFSMMGKQIVLNDIGPGDIFGELSAIDNQPRSACIIAMTEVVICSMSADNFHYVLQHYPTVNENILKRFCNLIRQLCGRIIEISTLPVKNRVHAEIMRLALSHKIVHNTVLIDPVPTHTDIANHIGTHREAVSREIAELKKLGIIKRSDNNVLFIKDFDRLQNLVRKASGMPEHWLKAS